MCLFRIKQGLLEVEVCPHRAGPRVGPVLPVAHAAVAGGVPLRKMTRRHVLGDTKRPHATHHLVATLYVPLPLLADMLGRMLPRHDHLT